MSEKGEPMANEPLKRRLADALLARSLTAALALA